MKVYYYTPADLGVESFHPGHLRLGGFERTENPHNADVWALGPIMHHFPKETLLNLKYLPGHEEQHVVWDLADDFRTFGMPWIAIRCACTKHILKADPTTIPWPWPVQPATETAFYKEARPGWHTNFIYDVVFNGWRSPLSFTEDACESVERTSLRHLLVRNEGFWGHMEEGEKRERMYRAFIANLYYGRLALVPTSIDGVVRYRLYEQMSLGRGLPVHLCDNVCYPWDTKIDWSACVVTIAEADAKNTGDLLVKWLQNTGDKEIRERAGYAKKMFDKWLHRDRWDELFGIAVRERLAGKL